MFNINSVINRTLIYFPIFKILINNINFIENNNVDTACTTGEKIYYNSEFFQKLTKDEQVFIISHELMHITLKHIFRLENRDIEIWNYATDAVINQILIKCGLPLVDGLINCPDALDLSAEEYYEKIKNNPACEEIISKYRHEKKENIISTHEYWNKELSEELSEILSDINEHNITEINRKLIHDENKEYTNNLQEQETVKNSLDKVGNASPIIDWKSFLQSKKKRFFQQIII